MDTWWIDKPHLLGSRNPTTSDLDLLRQKGFGLLISLLCEEEQSPKYDVAGAVASGFVRHNIAVKDFHPPTVEQLTRFVNLVRGLPYGTKVIVHCQGGIGRTGTFAAAYWVNKGMTASESISKVRDLRAGAVETSEQEAVLNEFARQKNSF